MGKDVIEKIVAIFAISLMAVFGPKFGMTEAMFSIAVAAIAGFTGIFPVTQRNVLPEKNK